MVTAVLTQKTARPIPSLGSTPEAVWRKWRELTEIGATSKHIVVGCLVGEGVYSWRHGLIVREFKARCRRLPRGYVATFRDATQDEVNRLWLAAERGWLQIEARTITGCLGLYNDDRAGETVRVYHQATGRRLV
jgi:hypothetical protein